jgi:hypothetical protein
MIDKKIINLAKQTRSWALNIAEQSDRNDPKGWDLNLTNMCVMCSAYLAYNLYKNGYSDVEIVDSGIHTFVMLENIVIDVTATQFGAFDDILVIRYEDIKDKSIMWSENDSIPKTRTQPWNDKEFGLEKVSGMENIIKLMNLHVYNICKPSEENFTLTFT